VIIFIDTSPKVPLKSMEFTCLIIANSTRQMTVVIRAALSSTLLLEYSIEYLIEYSRITLLSSE